MLFKMLCCARRCEGLVVTSGKSSILLGAPTRQNFNLLIISQNRSQQKIKHKLKVIKTIKYRSLQITTAINRPSHLCKNGKKPKVNTTNK
jgi:hypothetical protein